MQHGRLFLDFSPVWPHLSSVVFWRFLLRFIRLRLGHWRKRRISRSEFQLVDELQYFDFGQRPLLSGQSLECAGHAQTKQLVLVVTGRPWCKQSRSDGTYLASRRLAVPVVWRFRCGGNRWALCGSVHHDNGILAGVGRRL